MPLRYYLSEQKLGKSTKMGHRIEKIIKYITPKFFYSRMYRIRLIAFELFFNWLYDRDRTFQFLDIHVLSH